jgi:hypothetical protein
VIFRWVMKPPASRSVGGANAPTIEHEARIGGVQARRAGISVAVDDPLHPKSPSGATSGTTRRPSTIADDAAPLGLGYGVGALGLQRCRPYGPCRTEVWSRESALENTTNQRRQPMPDDRLGARRSSGARYGCALRWVIWLRALVCGGNFAP